MTIQRNGGHIQRAPNRFRFAGDHVVGPDGSRFSFDWGIEQLPWRDSLPGSRMPAHQYVVIDDRSQPMADVLSRVIAVHPDSFDAYFRGYQRPMRYLELQRPPLLADIPARDPDAQPLHAGQR